MIYYHCLDDNSPAGGRRVLYRHVDILNAAGIDAAIWHEKPDYRLTWFKNDTRIVGGAVEFQPDDVIVLPETRGKAIAEMYPGVRKVVFVQNPYYIWGSYNVNETETHWQSQDIIGMMVISDEAKALMDYTLPNWAVRRGTEIVRVRPSIDPVFGYSPDKEPVLACMPRKHSDELVSILNTLKWRGALPGWKIVVLDNMPLEKVAAELKRAAIFISTGYPEGCPMPPLEAAASGCKVIGYAGVGGREYWAGIMGIEIDPWDIQRFASCIELEGSKFDTDKWRYDWREEASRYALDRYSPDAEAGDVLDYWAKILSASTWDRYNHYWQAVTTGKNVDAVVSHMDQTTYDEYYRPILRRLEPETVRTIFDVGCGSGRLLPVIREFYPGAVYVGFDISANMVQAAEAERPGETFVHLPEFKLPAGMADFLFCHSVFTHVYEVDAGPMLDEIRRALAPGGRASISIHTASAEGGKGDIGRFDYDPAHFEGLLKLAGFKIIDFTEGYLPHGNQRYYAVEAI